MFLKADLGLVYLPMYVVLDLGEGITNVESVL